MTWECHVCGDTRPDPQISVFSRNVGAEFGMRAEDARENIRFCNDRPDCQQKARKYRLAELSSMRPKPEPQKSMIGKLLNKIKEAL